MVLRPKGTSHNNTHRAEAVFTAQQGLVCTEPLIERVFSQREADACKSADTAQRGTTVAPAPAELTSSGSWTRCAFVGYIFGKFWYPLVHPLAYPIVDGATRWLRAGYTSWVIRACCGNARWVRRRTH